MEFDLKVTFDLLPVFGVVLSLLSFYLWKFKDWYADLKPENKQLANGAILLFITLGAIGLSAAGVIGVYGGETWQAWVFPPLVDWVLALMANHATYGAGKYAFAK